jgi:hypothetical protein
MIKFEGDSILNFDDHLITMTKLKHALQMVGKGERETLEYVTQLKKKI